MNREHMLERLRGAEAPWDVLVIGGGATGLGCALDAAARGFRTVLLERSDFAAATSSRSTKLVHGGVRYLRSGHVSRVAQSLGERETIRRNAPGLVRELSFLIPAYHRGERSYYGAGLRLYDWLARRRGASGAPTRTLSRDQTLARVPTLRSQSLRGSVEYHDDQFDDARFALELARAAAGLGAVVLNYARVEDVIVRAGRVAGVGAVDAETGASFEVPARVVINATGVFADAVRRLDDPASSPLLRASRGAHVVVGSEFLPGRDAVLVPRTDDGRVVFMIPWRGRVLIGTTDTADEELAADPTATDDDIDFLVAHAGRYLDRAPARADVLAAFAGLRPLLAGKHANTAALARDHRVVISPRGLVTIAGGKWTTYRLMAEDAVTRAAAAAGLQRVPSPTARLRFGDAVPPGGEIERHVLGGELSLPALRDAAAHFVRAEMARRVEDVLARRTRALFLDARRCAALAAPVAAAMAEPLGRDAGWVARETAAFESLARSYSPAPR